MPITQILLSAATGPGGGSGSLDPFSPDVDVSGVTTSGWQILMATDGYKNSSTNVQTTPFASIGTESFRTANFQSTGAISRTAFSDGYGVYANWFLKSGITKIALVDGTGTLSDPTTNTNYIIYDLIFSTSTETIYDILRRLDYYMETANQFHGNDSLFSSPNVADFTAGTNGYSGLLATSGGTGFRDSNSNIPDKFAIMGINRDSDNDIQALCAYSGNLQSGKSDSWRGDSPAETFWSYWGNDFHTNSQVQRPGVDRQTAPGISTSVGSYSGAVYLLAY